MVFRHAESARNLLAHVRRPWSQLTSRLGWPKKPVRPDDERMPPLLDYEPVFVSDQHDDAQLEQTYIHREPEFENAGALGTNALDTHAFDRGAFDRGTFDSAAFETDTLEADRYDADRYDADRYDADRYDVDRFDVAPDLPPEAADDEAAAAHLAGDTGQVSQGESAIPGDFALIIAETVAALPDNTAARRHEVYDQARRIVAERLSHIHPRLGSFQIAREQLSLERTIKAIEAEYAEAYPEVAADVSAFADGSETSAYLEPTTDEDAVAADLDASAYPEETANEGAYFADPDAPADREPLDVATMPAPSGRARRRPAFRVHGPMLRAIGVAAAIVVAVLGFWIVTLLRDAEPTSVVAVAEAARSNPLLPAEEPSGAGINQAKAPAAQPAPVPPIGALQDVLSVCQRAPSPNEFLLCSSAGIVPTGAPQAVDQKLPFWVSSYHNVVDTAPKRPSDLLSVKTLVANTAVPAARERYESGLARARRDELDRAINDFSEAIRADPKFADAYWQRGQSLFKNGDVDGAIADFTAAISLDPRHAAACKARGMAMLYRGDEDAAISDLTSAIQYAEIDRRRLPAIDVFYALRSRAMLYDRRQLYDREVEDLSAMIEGYWKNQILVAALRLTYREQGAVSLMASVYRMRASAQIKLGNFDAAISDISFAMQLDPQRQLYLVLERARIQEMAGRRPQALADYSRALELSPNNDDAKSGLARLRGPA